LELFGVDPIIGPLNAFVLKQLKHFIACSGTDSNGFVIQGLAGLLAGTVEPFRKRPPVHHSGRCRAHLNAPDDGG